MKNLQSTQTVPKPKLFRRDFTMVVIGQIISLFGNNILRFALPLYLLNSTHSAALFGIVSACSFIPVIVLSPIGGIIADRVNKRNIMVILDFATAALVLIFTLLLGQLDLVVLTVTTLMILYAIQGAYSPSVQSSIPSLVDSENLVSANSVITLVNSLAGMIGPVIGGAVYGIYGIQPILFVSIGCFIASAVMEIFIHIPFVKTKAEGSIFKIAGNDMKDSLSFLKTKPVIVKIAIFTAVINLVFSALIIIGMPVVITEKLGFDEQLGNQLYGYSQGALAAGGLIGGLLAGTLSKKLKIQKSHMLLFGCSLTLLPIGLTLLFQWPSMVSYFVIIACCFIMMIASTVFSIQVMSYIQLITPSALIGKIMALSMCVCMCASPIGQAIYGTMMDLMKDNIYIIFFAAMIISVFIAFFSRKTFAMLEDKNQETAIEEPVLSSNNV